MRLQTGHCLQSRSTVVISSHWALVLGLLFLAGSALSGAAAAQSFSPSESSTDSELQQLYTENRWADIITLAQSTDTPSAQVQYYFGIALAQSGDWERAKQVFLEGRRLYRQDKRFPIELAGVEFKQKHYPQAASWLHRALRIDATDAYANDFLATVYFLNGNLEAALKYWNKVKKPQIREIHLDPPLQVSPVLLDHAFAFSPASTLQLNELRTTEARAGALDIFPAYTFALSPRDDGAFDVNFRAMERNGWGNNKAQALLSLFRGVFQQTVYPEYFNANRSAINFLSLARWDAQRRRIAASLSAPLRGGGKWRYRTDVDLRNENWQIRSSPTSDSPVLGALNLRRASVGAGITSIVSWRWQWFTGFEFSHRSFRDVVGETAVGSTALSGGYQLKQIANVNFELFRVPEYRFRTTVSFNAETARNFSTAQAFSKLQSRTKIAWSPGQANDLEIQQRISIGKNFGSVPFDELFTLGLDPDNDLFLRAHLVARDGRKGNAPIGSSYFLSNSEIDKTAYSNGLFTIKLGPFLDVGKIANSTYAYESDNVLCDVGAQAKIKTLGVGFTVSYGRDLRSGSNVVFLSVR